MDSVRREPSIRKLRVENVDDISEIYSLITKKAVNAELKKRVQEHALKEGHEAHSGGNRRIFLHYAKPWALRGVNSSPSRKTWNRFKEWGFPLAQAK